MTTINSSFNNFPAYRPCDPKGAATRQALSSSGYTPAQVQGADHLFQLFNLMGYNQPQIRGTK